MGFKLLKIGRKALSPNGAEAPSAIAAGPPARPSRLARAFHPEVTYDASGNVTGPPTQYVLSALERGRRPFTPVTAGKAVLFLSAAYLIAKGGLLNSPSDVVSALDSAGDAIVHLGKTTLAGDPELGSDYFHGFWLSPYKCSTKDPADRPGITCYAPGGTYYERAVDDPGYARLWGYGAEGMDPATRQLYLYLALAGCTAMFLFAHRQRLQEAVGQLGDLRRMWEARRADPTDPAAKAFFDRLRGTLQDLGLSTVKTAALLGTAAAIVFGIDRGAADTLATALMIAVGVGGMAKEYRVFFDAPGTMAWPKAIGWGLAYLGIYTAYRFMADSAGVYQFAPEGDPTLYGGWLDWDPYLNWDTLASSLANAGAIGSVLLGRVGSLGVRAAFATYARRSRLAHAATGDGWLARRRRAAYRQLVGTPDYLQVRTQVQSFTDEEKKAIRAGHFPTGPAGYWFWNAASVAGAAWLGWEGVDAATDVLSGTSPQVVADSAIAIAATSSTALFLDALLRDGKGRLLYNQWLAFMATLFHPQGRLAFWGWYTFIAGNVSIGTSVVRQVMSGFENKDNYLRSVAVRSFASPWVNRMVYGYNVAYRPGIPVSVAQFMIPGQLTTEGVLDYAKQTGQSLDMLYLQYARAYALSDTAEDRAAHLAKMIQLADIVEQAVARGGYGRETTLARARQAQAAIAQYNRTYKVRFPPKTRPGRYSP
ncbi:MAG: hypothetical protein HY543_03060 [Deltaproteobacteria bacterium]|nr:hypothetical protein [Deltaproteobacteria bacterium]